MSDYLTVIEALAIHADQIEHYGGADGVRDPGLLEAALYRQFANRHHLPHHVLRDKPSAQAHSLRSSTRSLAPCFCINFSRQISMICLDRCTMLAERRIKDRTQNLRQRLLDQSVLNRRYPQQSLPAITAC